jgi:hypothetical protein
MKRIMLTFFVASLLLGLTACGEEKSSVDYETIIQQFADALFAGKFEDAKAMLTEENKDVVSAQMDQFTAIYEKYKFQDLVLASTRPGTASGANAESDKRAQFTYQFSLKDAEDWAYGSLEIRAVNQDGKWVITELKLVRPKK